MARRNQTYEVTPKKSNFRSIDNTQMHPTTEVYTYTNDLLYAKDPITAMRVLLANESPLELFEQAGTEIMLERYDGDCEVEPLVAQLRAKFAALREKQKKAEPVKDEKKELDQEEVNRIFRATMKGVSTKKRSETKRLVDYSKFKVVKRAPRVALKTNRRVAASPNSTTSSSSSDVSPRSI